MISQLPHCRLSAALLTGHCTLYLCHASYIINDVIFSAGPSRGLIGIPTAVEQCLLFFWGETGEAKPGGGGGGGGGECVKAGRRRGREIRN